MLNKTSLDERQLWLRGNVFKHGFVFLLAALAAQGICKALGVTWAQGPGEQILILWGAVALCWWEFILRGIDPMGRSQKTFFFAMGLCGVFIVLMELASLAAGRGALVEEGQLTMTATLGLSGCLMASVLGVYLAKRAWDKGHPEEDEE